MLPQARDAALWQAYEAEFLAMANETEAAYLDVFAKNFKKAYARNLARADGGGR
jgi:predicted component of type VI protein secretion system